MSLENHIRAEIGDACTLILRPANYCEELALFAWLEKIGQDGAQGHVEIVSPETTEERQ